MLKDASDFRKSNVCMRKLWADESKHDCLVEKSKKGNLRLSCPLTDYHQIEELLDLWMLVHLVLGVEMKFLGSHIFIWKSCTRAQRPFSLSRLQGIDPFQLTRSPSAEIFRETTSIYGLEARAIEMKWEITINHKPWTSIMRVLVFSVLSGSFMTSAEHSRCLRSQKEGALLPGVVGRQYCSDCGWWLLHWWTARFWVVSPTKVTLSFFYNQITSIIHCYS